MLLLSECDFDEEPREEELGPDRDSDREPDGEAEREPDGEADLEPDGDSDLGPEDEEDREPDGDSDRVADFRCELPPLSLFVFAAPSSRVSPDLGLAFSRE